LGTTRNDRPRGGPDSPGLARPIKPPSGARSAGKGPTRSRSVRLAVPLASVGAVLAIVVGLVAASLTSGGTTASETEAPAKVVAQVTMLPGSVVSRIGAGLTGTPLQPVSGPPVVVDTKPAVVFVSEESCPFCAAERWPVVIALSQFGTWSHLGATNSSSTDVFPNTATFSFRNATYSSPYLTLRTTELADNSGHPLQPPTTLDSELINHYDVPPYVNTASQSGSVPFLDIDNHFILAGAQYDPQVLAGLSMGQIATQLRDPASPVAKAVDQSAHALIAAIDQVLHLSQTTG
jgi:hypothetical protein